MGEPVRWDGSNEAMRALHERMPDCLAFLLDDCLYVRTAGNRETPVPWGWQVTRTGDGIAVITPPDEDTDA